MSDEVMDEELQRFEDDEDLDQLEKALSKFNIFEAIGATNQELRHSNFLAFLLDPKQNHGLGSKFARTLLPRVLPELDDDKSFEDIDVRREYRDTDILIVDDQRKYVIIIENKILESRGRLSTPILLGHYYCRILELAAAWNLSYTWRQKGFASRLSAPFLYRCCGHARGYNACWGYEYPQRRPFGNRPLC